MKKIMDMIKGFMGSVVKGVVKQAVTFVIEKIKGALESVKYYAQIGSIMLQSAVTGKSPEAIIFAGNLRKLGLA